jgi:chromosome segregation ATPase
MTDLHHKDMIHPRMSIARRKTSNGPGALQALPDSRLAAVEQGLMQFHEVAAERDALRDELAALKQTHAQDQVEIAAMRSLINTLESRAASHQSERDLAVAQRSVYEALFVGVQAQFRAFEVPAAPLVKQLTDEHNAQSTANADTRPGVVE